MTTNETQKSVGIFDIKVGMVDRFNGEVIAYERIADHATITFAKGAVVSRKRVGLGFRLYIRNGHIMRTIDPAAFKAAKTITQVAEALGYTWEEWSSATIAERDDAVLAAKSGAVTFTPHDTYPTNDELNASILAALRRA
jgi:hypothetical protein